MTLQPLDAITLKHRAPAVAKEAAFVPEPKLAAELRIEHGRVPARGLSSRNSAPRDCAGHMEQAESQNDLGAFALVFDVLRPGCSSTRPQPTQKIRSGTLAD